MNVLHFCFMLIPRSPPRLYWLAFHALCHERIWWWLFWLSDMLSLLHLTSLNWKRHNTELFSKPLELQFMNCCILLSPYLNHASLPTAQTVAVKHHFPTYFRHSGSYVDDHFGGQLLLVSVLKVCTATRRNVQSFDSHVPWASHLDHRSYTQFQGKLHECGHWLRSYTKMTHPKHKCSFSGVRYLAGCVPISWNWLWRGQIGIWSIVKREIESRRA